MPSSLRLSKSGETPLSIEGISLTYEVRSGLVGPNRERSLSSPSGLERISI